MRTLAEQAAAVASPTKAAFQKLAAYLEVAHDPILLEAVESALDDWAIAYRDLWDEVAPHGVWDASVNRDDYEPTLRNMAACVTLFQLLGQSVTSSCGFPWGLHVVSVDATRMIAFDPLPDDLPAEAIKRMLPDFASDVLFAFDNMTDVLPAYHVQLMKDVSRALRALCDACKCDVDHAVRLGDGWGFELESAGYAANELGLTELEVEQLATDRRVVAVPLWNGKMAYPTFQFGAAGALLPEVQHVLEHAHDRLRGWPLALWLSYCVKDGKALGWYELELGHRGLWKPHWNLPGVGEFDDIAADRQTVAVNQPLYRITRRELGPFYFSSVRSIGGHVSPPAGRFDLDEALTGKGALYTAFTGVGACHEVLDREPVLTLREVLARTLWTIQPRSSLEVADLTDVSGRLANSTNRVDTQSMSLRMSDKHVGMKVGLRTSTAEAGVVFFGKRGPHLPAAAGLGVWSVSRRQLVTTDELWTYVSDRERDHESFPVIFRRLPGAA
jgi:hypothetical protein